MIIKINLIPNIQTGSNIYLSPFLLQQPGRMNTALSHSHHFIFQLISEIGVPLVEILASTLDALECLFCSPRSITTKNLNHGFHIFVASGIVPETVIASNLEPLQ
jgi:hypothetical protein